MLRHLQCNHGTSDHGHMSSDGIDLSYCDTAGEFVSSSVTKLFFTSGGCLQARDCIWNAWDLLSATGGALRARRYTFSDILLWSDMLRLELRQVC